MSTNRKNSLTVLVVLAVLLVGTAVFSGAFVRHRQSAGAAEQMGVASKASANTHLAPVQGKWSPAALEGKWSPAALEGRYSPAALEGKWSPAALEGRYSPAALEGKWSPASLEYNLEAPLTGGRTPTSELYGPRHPVSELFGWRRPASEMFGFRGPAPLMNQAQTTPVGIAELVTLVALLVVLLVPINSRRHVTS